MSEIKPNRRWSTFFDPMFEMVDKVELGFGGLYFVGAVLFVNSAEKTVLLIHKTPDAHDLRENYIPPLKVPEILIQYHDLERLLPAKDLNTFFKEAAIAVVCDWLERSFALKSEIFEKIKNALAYQTPLIRFFIPRVEILFVVENRGLITFPIYVKSLRGTIREIKLEEIFNNEWKLEKVTEKLLHELFAKQ